MNWNSIVRAFAAFAMYITLVAAHLSGLNPVSFALLSAVIISLGLWAHALNFRARSSDRESLNAETHTIVPSLHESMHQLHSLQLEINELQAQFANDADDHPSQSNPRGFAG